jgi:hypothetical protein
MPAKPNAKGGASTYQHLKSKEREIEKKRDDPIGGLLDDPNEFGPTRSGEGWRVPTQKERRLLKERQYEEDNTKALQFRKGGMVCREYGKKK